MNKLDGKSMDILEENIQQLQQLFPEMITDGQVDFDMLKQVLGDYTDDTNERYNFSWNGKGQALRNSQTPSMGTLRPNKSESKNWDTTENLYIEGDNLEVLKLLQKSYFGKVKMIYIDPPYNTGGDFVYKDDFKDSLQNYKEITGQVDGNGNATTTNLEYSGRYHTDWLNMIYPRLRLARNLLTDDGVIFISIDDNEQANLKKLCDEVFGEENFVNIISVKMSEASGTKMAHISKRFPKLKEYLFLYKKNDIELENIRIPKKEWDSEYRTLMTGITKKNIQYLKAVMENSHRTEEQITECRELLKQASYMPLSQIYRNENLTKNEEKTKYNYSNAHRIFQTVSLSGGTTDLVKEGKKGTKGIFFPIITPQNMMYVIKGDFDDNVRKPRVQALFADLYLTTHPCDFWQDIKTTGLDNEGDVAFKNGKKPLKLVKRILTSIDTTDSIILDFFSGSATTAHAVMQLNAEDGGNRKFIMVQLPEETDKKSEAYKAGYTNIAEIGKERIRRAGEQIKKELEEKHSQQNLDESHTNPERLDIGFKVLKLDTSNIKPWNPGAYEDIQTALADNVSPYVSGRTEQDVVFELMLKMGLSLTYPIEEYNAGNSTIYSIGFGALMICLSDTITVETANKMNELYKGLAPETWRVVCRDEGFASDSDKTNVKETLKSAGLSDDAFITL